MSRLGPLLSPILVGRDDLLDQADRRIAEAAVGRGQFLLLAGEAGIGKTRLIASIARRAVGAGFRTSAGFVAPQDRDVPAGLILDLARTMRRTPGFEALGSSLLDLVEEASAATLVRRRALVLRAVDMLAPTARNPLMLWFDDLQWADDISLEILGDLARTTRELPLLLIGAYRTDEVGPGSMLRDWRSRILAQRMAEEARLAPLTFEQTAQMTTVILANGTPAPTEVVEAIYERTDGIPLHVEELLGALADADRTDPRAIREAAVPATLEDAILQRVRRLSPDAQRVASSAAVIGRCFVPAVLAGIMDVPVDSLDAPLRELVDHNVIDPPGVRELYDFRHQLLRDALYRTIPPSELRRYHARAAEFGQQLEGASEVHASLHYERAGMREAAFHAAVNGARAAAKLGAHREAFGLFSRAIDNLPADLPAREAAALFEEAVSEAASVDRSDAFVRWATEARNRYLELGDAARAAIVRADILTAGRREGWSVAQRLAAIDEALQEIAALPESPEAREAFASARLTEALAAAEILDVTRARAALADVKVWSVEVGSLDMELTASTVDGMIDVIEGRTAEGLDVMEETARISREKGVGDAGVTAYRVAATSAVQGLQYRRAALNIAEGIPYSDAIEESYCSHVMAGLSGLIAWGDGRWDEAVSLSEAALANPGSARGPGMARWGLAYVALGRGDAATAQRHLEVARAFAEGSGAPDLVLTTLWGFAEADLVAGEYLSAIARTQRALEIGRESGERGQLAPFAVTGARARLASGRPAEARRWVEEIETVFSTAPQYADVIGHARALVAMADGSLGQARSSLEHAIRGWAERGRVWEELWARLDLAACLIRSNRFGDASSILADARDRATRLGSGPLIRRADELGRLARGHTAEDVPWHPLTARELEVARLIAGGRTNAEIADELGIAPKTASAHVEHILAKLGASRRAEIASWVARVGDGASGRHDAGHRAPDAAVAAGARN